MHKLSYIIIGLVLLISCNEEEDNDVLPNNNWQPSLSSFSYLKSMNPHLDNNIYLDIKETKITGFISAAINQKDLIATYKTDAKTVIVNNIEQESGITSNDFTNILTYKLSSNDGGSISYEVDLRKFTGLPIVYIDTESQQEINSKDTYVNGTVSIDGGRLSSDFTEYKMKIRGRGNSTWNRHVKKPYQLKLDDKLEFLDLPKDKKWVFLAEVSDKTLIRNKIAYEMGYLSSLDYTPKSQYSEVFLNGVYNGTYLIAQKVEESDRRVALGDTGYLIEIDQIHRLDEGDVYFRTYNYNNQFEGAPFLFNIKEPKLKFDTPEYTYIFNLIDNFEKNLKSPNFKSPSDGYTTFIDVDSFIDYYLINEITKNTDAKEYSSIYLNVMPGEKIKMGPIWDFDLAFGNVDYAPSQYATGFWIKDNAWYARLFEDPEFVAKVKLRFSYYLENQSSMLDKIDAYAALLTYAQQENDKKWGLLGTYHWPNPVVYDTYQEEVDHLKDWYISRMNWLENAFDKL
jgi:spore coat protein CotH